MNVRLWARRAAIVGAVSFLPVALFAQAPASPLPESAVPAEVTKALRERVNTFFGYHVGSANRKAIDLVAEDTKDYYYTSGKVSFDKFAIKKIEYDSKAFDRAEVTLEVTLPVAFLTEFMMTTRDMVTQWKIENGQWMWYADFKKLSMLPQGPSASIDPISGTQPLQTTKAPPSGFDAQKEGTAILNQIADQAALDKNEVKFVVNVPGKQVLTMKHGFNGMVDLRVSGPPIPGVTVKLSTNRVNRGETATLTFDYAPVAETPAPDGDGYKLNLTISPFNIILPVSVSFQAK